MVVVKVVVKVVVEVVPVDVVDVVVVVKARLLRFESLLQLFFA